MMEALRTWAELCRLRSSLGCSPRHLRSLQDSLLKEAVDHAYASIPFYRRAWAEAGFHPSALSGIPDLIRLPLITATMVREAAERGELLAQGVETSRCTYLDSSGSSGRALRIWKRPLEERVRRAIGLRIWFEHGFSWRDVTVQFQIKPGPPHPLQRLGIGRKVWISTAHPILDQMQAFVEARADVVVGTATALRNLAGALQVAGLTPKRPRFVLCAGELLDSETRRMVNEALRADPIALYGQTEVGYVAWECERRTGLHVNADTHLVEVLQNGEDAAEGELGNIVITDLRSRTMPLLRYATGDLGIAASSPCECGRFFPRLASIEGRARSSVLLADGRTVTTRTIVNQLAGSLRLGHYRLHQLGLAQFRLELSDAAEEDGLDDAIGRLFELLGEVELAVDRMPPWPPDATGKTHTVFSTMLTDPHLPALTDLSAVITRR
jgi:phenylacetate-CoA ligase